MDWFLKATGHNARLIVNFDVFDVDCLLRFRPSVSGRLQISPFFDQRSQSQVFCDECSSCQCLATLCFAVFRSFHCGSLHLAHDVLFCPSIVQQFKFYVRIMSAPCIAGQVSVFEMRSAFGRIPMMQCCY